ncbi:MAG: hypothetical protein MJZ15_09080 [Bacteroidales bacterium]|nr:hypothetical protein [Bacteroidales bacterium]
MNINITKVALTLAVAFAAVSCIKEDDNNSDDKRKGGVVQVPQTVSYDMAVDMGLSVRWSKVNMGALTELDAGDYYAWGEVTPKDTFTLKNYQHYDTAYVHIGKDLGGTQYDAARMEWGGQWRMPTITEWKELVDSCQWRWRWDFKYFGYEVTGPSGNSIYLPAAGSYRRLDAPYKVYDFQAKGYYWSSSFFYVGIGYRILFNSNKPDVSSGDLTYIGMPIRPVVKINN